jgi:hypothetical protein
MSDETKSNDELENKEMTVSDKIHQMYSDVWGSGYGATSFSDLEAIDRSGDAIEDLSSLHGVASAMIYNIMDYSPDKIPTARKMLTEYFDMANAVLDEHDATKSETKEQRQSLVDKAKKFISEFKEKAKAKKKVADEEDKPADEEEDKKKLPWMKKELSGSGIMVFKDANGKLRWFASYSNNFRDSDNPAEIISKESHQNFVDMVDKGLADYPEVWHWHTPGSAWGKADWVAFDDENGISMASGTVYEGHEKEAIAIAEMDEPLAVSHGMPKPSIARSSEDPTVITRHITKEISDLPLWAAANKLTSFYVFQENDMAIPDNKKEYLRKVGLTDDSITAIESANAQKSAFASDNSIESKEANTEAETTETPAEATAETVVETQEAKETSTVNVNLVDKEFVAQLADVLAGFGARLESIETQVKSLSETQATKEVTPSEIPAASLSALIARNMSATKSKEALVRKGSELAESGPTETKTPTETVINTANPLVDRVITNMFK